MAKSYTMCIIPSGSIVLARPAEAVLTRDTSTSTIQRTRNSTFDRLIGTLDIAALSGACSSEIICFLHRVQAVVCKGSRFKGNVLVSFNPPLLTVLASHNRSQTLVARPSCQYNLSLNSAKIWHQNLRHIHGFQTSKHG